MAFAMASAGCSLGGVASLRVTCAKGRNAKMKGRKSEPAAPKKAAAPAEPKVSGVKYSKRGKISTQTGGQISKAQYKKIQQATSEAKAKQEEMEEKRAARADEYRQAEAQAIPQVVTDRMLKRIFIFSGVPLLLGFSTGPIFYGLKVVGHVDVPSWAFFAASTATYGAAFLGITYGVLSASWEPGREGSFSGLTEFKANIPILFNTIMGKSKGEELDWDDNDDL